MCNTMEDIDNFLSHKVGTTALVEEIYPYARPRPHGDLMRDIRSFHTDMTLLENICYTDGKPVILYNDLMMFLLNTDPPRYPNSMRYIQVLKRFGHHSGNVSIRDRFRKLQYYGDDEDIQQRRSRQIMGMLTPEERTRFINQFMIFDTDA